MGFFDDLNRFTQDIMKSLKPEEVVKLKSCKRCNYYKRGYCTQTSPPTKILSEYYAQGCIYYTTEEAVISSQTGGTVTVDEVKKGTIDELKKIGYIAPSIYVGNRGQLMNPDFEEWYYEKGRTPTEYMFQGWIDPSGIAKMYSDNPFTGFSACTLKKGSGIKNGIFQAFSPPIPRNDIDVFTINTLNNDPVDSGVLKIRMFYSDGTASTEAFSLDEGGEWDVWNIVPDADKYIVVMRIVTTDDVFTEWDVCVIDMLSLRYKETVNVDIIAQTIGNLGIDIVAQTIGNLGIDLKAQSVDMDIKTSGGANILIDKLEQTAYTERRSTTISNDNGVTSPTAPPSNANDTFRGKFFPRGMRGMLESLRIYCKRTGAGTVTLAYSPHPSMGEIGTVEITPDADWDWKYTTIRKMWSYDSLFVWVKSCDADVSYGYDNGTPPDWYKSVDSGVTWYGEAYRLFVSIKMYGETVGDIPVSGTINTIQVPSESQTQLLASNATLPTSETTLKEVDGAGHTEYLQFRVAAKADSHKTIIRVYCDGNKAFEWSFADMSGEGYTASTQGISLTNYGVDAKCSAQVMFKFNFTWLLKITMEAVTTADQVVIVEGLVNLIK